MQLSKQILFEHEDYVVINKPAGLLTIPDRYNAHLPSLSRWLEQRYGAIFIVHRLDKDTSGVIVFARNEESHKYLSAQFQANSTEKKYLGLVAGLLRQKEGRIDTPIMEHPVHKGKMFTPKKEKTNGQYAKREKPALTTFKVVESFTLYTLLELSIFTGRTHQIRVHLQSIGHPVAMDELYGNGRPFFLSFIKKDYHVGKSQEEEKPLMTRMALHAASLSFKDRAGEKQTFEAPLPKDFRAVLSQLRKHARVEGV